MIRKVRRLVDFALRLVPAEKRPDSVSIHQDCQETRVAGEAGGGQVDIYLPKRLYVRKYPRRDLYKKSAGALVYRCWCEEVVATAAHEIRHIGQDLEPKKQTPKNFEVDAESFARFALDIYRMRKRCRHA